MAEGRRARRRDLGGRRAFYTEDAAHNARGQGRGAGAGRDTLKLELGSGRTQSREENILKRKGFRRGEIYAFYFKKEKGKKKEMSVAKMQLANRLCTKLERRRERWRMPEGGPGFRRTLSMNFSKIIFIWQQVTLKNLLSGDT